MALNLELDAHSLIIELNDYVTVTMDYLTPCNPNTGYYTPIRRVPTEPFRAHC